MGPIHVKSDHREVKLLEEAIDEAGLDEQMRSYLKRRYLEYLRWLEDGSTANRVGYYALRISPSTRVTKSGKAASSVG
ncbi:MAG: hypothetical protein ACXWZB_06195 [Gaiellaceae bacterium]